MMQLLLAGIAINALSGGAIGILSYIGDEQQLRQLTLWMMEQSWTGAMADVVDLPVHSSYRPLSQQRRRNAEFTAAR